MKCCKCFRFFVQLRLGPREQKQHVLIVWPRCQFFFYKKFNIRKAFYIKIIADESRKNFFVRGGSFVQLFINGKYAYVAANSAGTGNTVNWKQFTYYFTATTTSTNLLFANSDSSSDYYCGLDAISVTAPQQVAFIQQPSDTAGSMRPEVPQRR